jgi:hypothetical protein
MIGGNELLERIRSTFPGATIRPVFPFLRVRIVRAAFTDQTESEREEAFAAALGLDLASLRSTGERLFLRFELLGKDSEDSFPLPATGETWLGTFADPRAPITPLAGPWRVLHFYGFKGGQGRSTLLGFAANELARDGFRVLVVDLDAEAPSLDIVFSTAVVPPEATLVGLRAGLPIVPVSVSAPRGGGSVSLLSFRPSDSTFDIDATALAFEASVHPPSSQRLAMSLRDGIAEHYDVLLMDHRTGLGPTVPSWVHSLPGPVLVFDRLDGQSARATRDVGRIWSGLENPGLLVSYVPPPVAPERFRERARGEAWGWLDTLARAKSERASVDLGPDDIEDHWVLWPYDNAFHRRGIPQRDEVGGLTREAVNRIRELVGLNERRTIDREPQLLHPSGAADQGLFIATEALRELCQPASPIRFVLGRKGTGKTRLLSELARRGVGEPLVVAEDETSGGVPSSDLDLKHLLAKATQQSDLEGLWWTLLRAAIQVKTTQSRALRDSLHKTAVLTSGVEVRDLVRSTDGPSRVFLIDGLETLSKREQAQELIQALLKVASALEQDPALRSRVSLRIFLRSDIAKWGFENFEQQSHGRTLELSWSTQTILNFVLSRLPHLPWIASMFRSVIDDVVQQTADIEEGALSEEECMRQLLRIFPAKLGRLNLNTSTFLRTYFSDDPSGEASYYPRVYHTFLESIDQAKAPLEAARIRQDIILKAHDQASDAFLAQVRQELRFLTPLDDRDLDRLINALKGRGTPFVAKTLRREVRNSLKLPLPRIEAAFDAMKEIGMFEQHPKQGDQWRVGRLFKSALKMKYGRGLNV